MQSPRVPLIFNLMNIKASAFFFLFSVNSPSAHCTCACSSQRIRTLQGAFPAKRQLLGCWWPQVRTSVLLTAHPYLPGSLRVYEVFPIGVKPFSSVSASADLIHINSHLLWARRRHMAPSTRKISGICCSTMTHLQI